MREKIVKLYTYDELNADAQRLARDDWRATIGEDYDADSVTDDAATLAEFMGLDLRQRRTKLGGGATGWGVSVYYSLYGQGSGASFDATWHACNVKPGEAAKYAPQDAELARIAGEFERIAKAYPTSRYSAKSNGRYSIDFDIDMDPPEDSDDIARSASEWKALRERDDKVADELREVSKDLAGWIYRRVLSDYEWQTADEQVAESIRANELEFTDKGRRDK